MSLFEDKHRLFWAYVQELNTFRPGNEETEEEAREVCDRYISSPDCTWKNIFAPDTQELVGFLILGKAGKEKHPDSGRAIAEAYVAPEYRGRGLMTAAIDDYESRHRCVYSLLVLKNNEKALRYWQKAFGKHHYRPIRLDPACVDSLEDIVLLGFRPGTGFDAPAIGTVIPKEAILVKNPDGTISVMMPDGTEWDREPSE